MARKSRRGKPSESEKNRRAIKQSLGGALPQAGWSSGRELEQEFRWAGSLRDAMNDYLDRAARRGLTEGTMRGYESILRRALERFIAYETERWEEDTDRGLPDDDIPVRFLKLDHVEYLIDQMREDECQANTINQNLNVLKSLCHWLIEQGAKIAFDPERDIEYLRETKRLRRILTAEEFEQFLSGFDGRSFTGLRMMTYAKLLLDTGARQQEAAHIQMDDVRDGFGIRVLGKGRRERDLIPSSRMWEELREWLEVRQHSLAESGIAEDEVEWLFPTLHLNHLTSSLICTQIKEAREAAGVKRFRCHDLRHTWATNHIRAGTNPMRLRELGGWADMQIVMTYVEEASPEELAEIGKASVLDQMPKKNRIKRKLR